MPRKQKKYHYIYKTTCQVTGKFYVGMHSTDNLEDGYLGSGKILGYSRHKYGDENHTKEILFYCSSRDELKQKEREVVNEELLTNPLNINLKYGGDGGWEYLNDGSTSHQARCRKGGQTGGKKTGTQNLDKNRFENARKSLETRRGTGQAKPDEFTMLGKTHTEKTKQQMSESGRGERNSQFGIKRVGINKNGKIKKVLPEQLQEFLDGGWEKGFRKINMGASHSGDCSGLQSR